MYQPVKDCGCEVLRAWTLELKELNLLPLSFPAVFFFSHFFSTFCAVILKDTVV
jgi:hypothetical protein